MQQIRILALDLDGTLLNSNKELTPRTRQALFDAHDAGVDHAADGGHKNGRRT